MAARRKEIYLAFKVSQDAVLKKMGVSYQLMRLIIQDLQIVHFFILCYKSFNVLDGLSDKSQRIIIQDISVLLGFPKI